jgi:hypothetical protein
VTDIPPATTAPRWAADTRPPLPNVGDERQILTAFLDWYRQTFELKCAGVAPGRLSERGVPPSALSLHGLLRHLAGVERWWFRQQFAGEDIPLLYYSDDRPDLDFADLDGDVAEALGVWRDECARARRIVADAPSLDDVGTERATGEPVSLRRIMVAMIGEYARHVGHADLLREQIDGATGY